MKRLLFCLFILFTGNIFAEDGLTPVPQNKYLVSYTLVKTHTFETIKALWKSNKIPKFILPINYEVDIYEVVYNVRWIDSTWQTASGVYFVPKTDKPVPCMAFGHGTQIEKNRNISDGDAQQGICLGFATDGYSVLMPDYYGIGKGDGRHLYQHASTEANAFIYMLYAVEELNQKINLHRNGQLFLTGYSQGGHSSMAAQKYLEEMNNPNFKVTASSPMSGAYDMTGEQAKYMFKEYPKPFYLPYLLISYQAAYHILDVDNIYTIFKSPYDTLLQTFFENNNNKSFEELDKIMPRVPSEVLRDTFVQLYLNDSNFPFKKRLEENNLTNWKPEAPMQLCYCKGDREVNYMNSEVAYASMKAKGAENIKLHNFSNSLDHNTCAAFAVLSTKYYFDRFVKHGKNPKMKGVPAFKRFLVGFIKHKEEKKYKKEGKDQAYF